MHSANQNRLPGNANGVTLALEELLYYKAQTVRWLPPARSLWSQLNGVHTSMHQGRGMNFSEVRQYQPGDDIRAIDWRVTARTGKPHTKLFTEEREQPVMLYLDFSKTMRFGSQLMLKSVQMAHMASLLSWLAVEQKDRIGAVLDSGSELYDLKPTSRNRGPLQLFNHLIEMHNAALEENGGSLSAFGQEESSGLSAGLRALHKLCPKGSEIVLCSDFTRFAPETDQPLLAQLRQHNRVSVIQFYDPLELGKTSFRGVEKVTDGRQTQWLNFSAASTRRKLEQAFESEQEKIQSACRSLAIPYYSISSAEPLTQQIVGNTQ